MNPVEWNESMIWFNCFDLITHDQTVAIDGEEISCNDVRASPTISDNQWFDRWNNRALNDSNEFLHKKKTDALQMNICIYSDLERNESKNKMNLAVRESRVDVIIQETLENLWINRVVRWIR